MAGDLTLVLSTQVLNWDHREFRTPWSIGQDPARLVDLPRLLERARRVEAAGFDAIFQADFIGLNRAGIAGSPVWPVEPLTLMAALAAGTSHIGLVGTVSTQFSEPYNVARAFASLTQLAGSRVGWNVVTSFHGEQYFGREGLPAREARYERADEFLTLVNELLGTWQAGYLVNDAEGRRAVDVDRIAEVSHHGKHFDVDGALDIPLWPHEPPVIFQAGASDAGLDFAGRHAEAVFSAGYDEDETRAYVDAITAAARRHGRGRADFRFLPGVNVYLGETAEAAAHARDSPVAEEDLLRHFDHLKWENEDFRLDDLGLDDPIPESRLPSEEQIRMSGRRQSRSLLYRKMALKPGATVRGLLLDTLLNAGHSEFVGTPETVACAMERWHGRGLADGFVITRLTSLDMFIEEVLPRLRRKGLRSAPSAGASLRGRLAAAAC